METSQGAELQRKDTARNQKVQNQHNLCYPDIAQFMALLHHCLVTVNLAGQECIM